MKRSKDHLSLWKAYGSRYQLTGNPPGRPRRRQGRDHEHCDSASAIRWNPTSRFTGASSRLGFVSVVVNTLVGFVFSCGLVCHGGIRPRIEIQ